MILYLTKLVFYRSHICGTDFYATLYDSSLQGVQTSRRLAGKQAVLE